MRVALSCLFIVSLSLGSLAGAAEEKSDLMRMQGTWIPSKAQVAGNSVPDEAVQSMVMSVKDATFSVKVGEDTHKGAFKLDGSTTPKSVDYFPTEGDNNGKTFLAIYAFEKDTLRICYSLDAGSGERPTDFTSTEQNKFLLITYRRK